ncbi:hypothetical protein K443DRAFT_325061 [Laccaria amethystina LaAM-08-1]|uniref:Uncharacterized protein n=1 Tax=Laccaria amethystina LaAM-08-1 TaxID=1095629 RepID=A0A0C9XCN2_9AGAR|nr:hypothetical protein K443DRAFT_325061 [Laccaria amethystina LaAM-08-1]
MATKRERQKSLEIMRSGWGGIEMRVSSSLNPPPRIEQGPLSFSFGTQVQYEKGNESFPI